MQVVSDESTNDVISWLPHGKGFIIYKKKKFASDVLPKAFKQSKYTSFTRKLNRWGFTRVTRGPETGAYYHKVCELSYIMLSSYWNTVFSTIILTRVSIVFSAWRYSSLHANELSNYQRQGCCCRWK
jgi:hypothetical protein